MQDENFTCHAPPCVASAQRGGARSLESRHQRSHRVDPLRGADYGGHIAELKCKYKLRVTEITIAAGGYVGHHNHLGPGIRQMTEGEMDYIMPDKTVVYRTGDFFFETGDVSHRVESPEPSQHLLFEILPIDVDAPSLILPRDE